MAWSFTNLSYGWKYVVGVVLAGTTIYVASNTRWRVNQADVIELALGVHERCLATQTATNPTYAVDPPSFVRSWYSNSYVTTNVPGDAVTNWTAQLHTNVFTNVIGWRTDRAMMVELDAKIKELVPHYVDTDSVYDGTTNIIMHTFTGLLTSLDLGDHTNFTAIPAIGTNAATYGPWAWRNYIVAWQERYKVLEALKVMIFSTYTKQNTSISADNSPFTNKVWSDAKSVVDGKINTATTNVSAGWLHTDTYGVSWYIGDPPPLKKSAFKTIWLNSTLSCQNYTCFNGELNWYVALTNPAGIFFYWGWYGNIEPKYAANGTPNVINGLSYKWGTENIGSNDVVVITKDVSSDAVWCDEASVATGQDIFGSGYRSAKGFVVDSAVILFAPTFNYCTDSI